MTSNFLHTTGNGHCFHCHKDFKNGMQEHWREVKHDADSVPTLCDELCPTLGEFKGQLTYCNEKEYKGKGFLFKCCEGCIHNQTKS